MNPNFLKRKYELHNDPEVAKAARRTEFRTSEKVKKNPEDLIQNYLDRFKEIIDRPDKASREQGIEAIKRLLLDKFVTKYKDIPDSYWQLQESIMRERGQAGDWSRATEEEKEKAKHLNAEAVLSDQSASLEQWIDYFASPDSDYLPDYLKYWVFRSVVNLGEYDKEKQEFSKRSKGTVKLFPDINHEALAYVTDAVVKKQQGQNPNFNYDIQENSRKQFEQYLGQENFAKIYGWAVELINPIPEHLLKVTTGEWKKYHQNSNHHPLVDSITGKGTGWCTAGETTAKNQLAGGDFYVFYSLNDDNQPTIPRIAIRMEQGNIAEVRGIAPKQNLDSYMGEVLQTKLLEFPDGDKYLKKDVDMQTLTQIEKKTKQGDQLTKDELVFLYEINSKIEGFGYQSDPRIKELRDRRDKNADMLIIFDCQPDQIIHNQEELEKATKEEKEIKVFVGELFPDIFKILPSDLEYLFTEFPEGKIKQKTIKLGTGLKTKKDFITALEQNNNKVGDWAKDIVSKAEFVVSKKEKLEKLIILSVADLGFKDGAKVKDIFNRAKELGLELCPPETGPQLRLQYQDQSNGEYCLIGMDPIADSNGYPSLFSVDRHVYEPWLDTSSSRSDDRYAGRSLFAFALASSS